MDGASNGQPMILTNENGTQDQVVPFLNIYDKGYRAKMVAWKNGKH